MAFWCRIKQSKLRHLTNQLKRYYIQVPSLNHSAIHPRIFATEKPIRGIVKKATDFCNNARFFAAPAQAQSKNEDKDIGGPRLNVQIKAQVVRLVSEEGHRVVPMHEALALARELELDLVEVQRNANPPVCKIMDFHREKYKKEVQEKERAKAKSDVTLKKGDCKEVRFTGKIEQKDLKMKADTVKRLIEKGYRVKCMALPVSKKEEEDLGGYLSRLTALIEDVAVIESGPHVERKQAYVVIRHVKFGPSKKGGGKKSKIVGDASGISMNGTPQPTKDHLGGICRSALEEDPAEFGSETAEETLDDGVNLPESLSMGVRDKKIGTNKTAWSVSNSGDDFSEVFDFRDDTRGPTTNFTVTEMNEPETTLRSANLSAAKFSGPKPGFGFSRADTLPSVPPEPSLGTGNRYKRCEPRNQFPQKSIDNRGPGVRDSFRSEPQFPSPRQPPPSSMPRQEPSRSGISNAQPSSYGIFSNPTANAPAGQGVAPNIYRNREGSPSNSVKQPGTAGLGANQNIPGLKSIGSQRPGLDNGGQEKFGIFSR